MLFVGPWFNHTAFNLATNFAGVCDRDCVFDGTVFADLAVFADVNWAAKETVRSDFDIGIEDDRARGGIENG